jgi:hypothetical protein
MKSFMPLVFAAGCSAASSLPDYVLTYGMDHDHLFRHHEQLHPNQESLL